jgi:hypothetical protein
MRGDEGVYGAIEGAVSASVERWPLQSADLGLVVPCLSVRRGFAANPNSKIVRAGTARGRLGGHGDAHDRFAGLTVLSLVVRPKGGEFGPPASLLLFGFGGVW